MNNTYTWQGINQSGERIAGSESSQSRQQLQAALQCRGITLLKIQRQIFWRKKRRCKITVSHKTDFIRQLAFLCQAHVNVITALQLIQHENIHSGMQQLILTLQRHIENGLSFHQALGKFPEYFDPIDRGLILAGEQSGALPKTLTLLATYHEQMLQLRNKIIKALLYPSSIMILAALINGGLLVFVVPQFNNIFNSFGAQLPTFTRWVIRLSAIVQHQFVTFLFILLSSIGIYRWGHQRYPAFAVWKDQQLLNLPIIGRALTAAIFARWAQVLAILLEAGIPMVNALQTTLTVVTNRYYQRAMMESIDRIIAGSGFYQALAHNPRFPRQMIQLLSVGENAGQLTVMLNKIAVIQQAILDKLIDYFSKWLEPAVMFVLAVLTGGLIIAMYLPVFELGAIV